MPMDSVINSILVSGCMSLGIALFLRKQALAKTEIKVLRFCVLISALRLLVPVKLPFTLYIQYEGAAGHWLNGKKNLPVEEILPKEEFFSFFLIVWFCGALLLAFFKIFSYIRWKREWKGGVIKKVYTVPNILGKEKEVPVIERKEISEPFIAGICNPRIFLPKLSEEEFWYVLAHELQHYRQGDLYLKFLLESVCTLYWWNPFVFLLRQSGDKLCELLADRNVTEEMSLKGRLSYAYCLLHLMRKKKTALPTGALGIGSRNRFLKQRIYTVTEKREKGRAVRGFGAVCVVLLVFWGNLTVSTEVAAVSGNTGHQEAVQTDTEDILLRFPEANRADWEYYVSDGEQTYRIHEALFPGFWENLQKGGRTCFFQ